MNLVQEYVMLAIEVISFVEYDNQKSVNEYNRKVTRMRKIAIEIENEYPGLKYAFCQLLSHENMGVRVWAAHHILEIMDFGQSSQKSALNVIRHKARNDKTVNGLGEKMWLKNWYELHPKDRWI